ncbi:MAG: hypothetical protein WC376_01495 [Candidatus Nanoarchaeia archaeon]|jgi:transcription initiation factor TFIIIB Brf1 subunit/transcription initiation factor TFIIB
MESVSSAVNCSVFYLKNAYSRYLREEYVIRKPRNNSLDEVINFYSKDFSINKESFIKKLESFTKPKYELAVKSINNGNKGAIAASIYLFTEDKIHDNQTKISRLVGVTEVTLKNWVKKIKPKYYKR